MATSGAYKNSEYTFNFSFTKASDPTAFFTGTFLTSEVKVVTRDGGTTNAATNIASAPSHEGNGVYEINLTASEMNHDEIMIVLVPSSADVVPESISIVTEPTPSDILEVASSTVSGVADFKATGFSTFNPATDTVANVSSVASVSGSVGSISGVTFPTNFSDLAISATTGRVTVGTNADKTGYSLSQSFPANFADLEITASTGRVSTGTNYDKTGYSLSQTFPTNFADLSISATTGRVDVGSMAADTITASAIAADAVTELQNGVATAAALSSAAAEISAILADTGTDGVVISSATANAIADAILSRNVSNTEATAAEHTLTTIVLAILESARTTTDWNIYRTNGSTVHAAKSISTDAAALPVVGVS